MSDFLERVSKLPPNRLALLAHELNNRLERLEQRSKEAVAVIGIGCRFPGGANGPDAYWRNLQEGKHTVREIPPERWDAEAYYDPDPSTPGRMTSKWGSFLDDVDRFDAAFFGISPREAMSLDPHQRLLLEVTWEALEHAGQAADAVMGSQTGVFVGSGSADYYQLLFEDRPASLNAYLVSGNAPSMMSGRLSYFLGVHGPSLTIDTACSSSLVAVHVACQSLRSSECRMAIAGGANLILAPDNMIGLSQARMLSPDGHCRAFDAGANGIVRGEGCGVVVLKRLSDAQADGDRILAVLRGTAINQDGRSNGITAPNGPAQEAVIREALERSGIEPSEVDYVECHGTGTTLGDPIELRALGAVLGKSRPVDRPVQVGSVKTNMGHLEVSAGIAGLIKVVLALHHEEIPAHLHFRDPNPYVEWDQLPVRVVTERTPWSSRERRRIAGVSSFGFSGTNAHVIVEEAPPQSAGAEQTVERPVHLLALSARTRAALEVSARNLAEDVRANPDRPIADVCFTANTGRAHMAERAALTARTSAELVEGLALLAEGDVAKNAVGRVTSSEPPPIGFLFTGQGSQYVGMGRELYETQPTFRRALEECHEFLKAHAGLSLLDSLYPAGGPNEAAEQALAQTAMTQPALFAVEYALAEVWRAWGVKPAVVIGHSLGEYAAACVAGIFTLDEGLTLVTERARLMQQLPAGGTMAALMAPEAQVAAVIAEAGRAVAIAAINGPRNVVVSGAAADVDAVCARLAESGVQARRLNVSHAFHSVLMEPMLAGFERAAARVAYREPQMDVISNVTGRICASGDLTPEYWRRHTRQPVRFADGIATALEQGCRLFVEIGPTPQLSGLASQCAEAADVLWLPSLRRGRPDAQSMLSTAGRLYTGGARIDWRGFDRDYRRRKVALPTYPFQRERFWPEHRAPAPLAAQAGTPAWADWLYDLEWERRARSDSSASFLPQPAELAMKGREQVAAACAENNTIVYNALYPALDAACTSYIVSAFRALGVPLTTGQRLTAAAAARTMGVKPAHRRLFGRLLQILEEDGVLRREGDGWAVTATPGHADPAALVRSLLDRFPSCSAEINLTAACAPSLAQVLTGRVDPLQVLFPRGDFSAAAAVYEHAPALRVFNTLLAERVAHAAAAAPPQSTVRVLEIGGGTGSATSYVLPGLTAGRTEYTFSDVSAAFLPHAQEKFARFDFVKYQVLDVEEDPARQGFKPGSFDIVIAANVVHATRDIRETLGKIRTLLAPGGLLFLLEGTRTQRFGDLTVGYTEGWWRFADTDLRPDYALLTADQWRRVLQDEGFTGSETFPDARVHEQAIFENQSIIIARAPVEQKAGAGLRGPWLVCGNPDGLGARLVAELRHRGVAAALAVRGDAYSADLPAGQFALDAESREHLLRALRELAATAAGPVNAVHLWALEERTALDAGVEEISRGVRRGCGSALALVQALAELPSGAGGTLTCVTRNAQPLSAGGPPLEAVQSPLWGLGRVVDLEHPDLQCLRLDLGPHPEGGDARAIVNELEASTGGERQVALRGADRSVLRMVRHADTGSKTETAFVRPDAAYLVTGGLAGLGLEVARWLVDRGATRLVLASRGKPSSATLETIAALGARGTSVATVQADVSTPAGIDAIFAACAADPRPLRGVIHSAGVTDDASLLQQRWERFENVMAAKVRGSWLLHMRTARMPLDFFVLFSSGASFIGSPGQSNHAAANAFLDSLAFHRRALGLPALSINWGAWSKIGAATRGDVLDRVSLAGLNHIDPTQGFAVLEHLMRSEAAQTAVLPIRWPEFLAHATAIPRAFFERVATDSTPPGSPVNREARRILDDVRSAPAARRRPMLMTIVEREACRVLGLGSSNSIDPTQPLNALGLDSLMAVELRNALAALTGHPLPATLLFNYPTVVDLVEFLAAEMALDGGAAEQAAAPAAEPADLEAMSEDEIAALLAGKLAGAGAQAPGGAE